MADTSSVVVDTERFHKNPFLDKEISLIGDPFVRKCKILLFTLCIWIGEFELLVAKCCSLWVQDDKK